MARLSACAGWFASGVSASVSASSYPICATPRSGSTLLCGLLRSTGIAGRPESYFRLPDEQNWADRWQLARNPAGCFDYRDYVRAAVAEGSTENGVFGARVMWGTMDEIVVRLRAACPDLVGSDLDLLAGAFGLVRFVHLRRENTLAQAVSWARAEQTNYWHPGDAATPGHRPCFDYEQIRGLVETIDSQNAAWRDWFAAIDVRPHVVSYEALIADPAGVTHEILDFLGLELPDDHPIASGHQRQADEINDDWMARCRAIADASTMG